MNVGLIGFGTVGSEVVRILQQMKDIELVRIVDKDITTPRSVPIDRNLLTDDPKSILQDDKIKVVIELIGNHEPARTILLTAMRSGKSVVTANKEVLSRDWEQLIVTAKESNVGIGFEAAVGGAIPIISSICRNLVGDKINSIYGIINGTCNYILTKMEQEGIEFSQALSEAQRYGYAEAVWEKDVEGKDSAHKLAILANIAFGGVFSPQDIYTEGITNISHRDILYAHELGYRIKLLGIAKYRDGLCELRVHPTMLPLTHGLSTVDGVYNAIYVEAEYAGDLMLYGRGAGGAVAASAVVGDLLSIRKQIQSNIFEVSGFNVRHDIKIWPIYELETTYYIRFMAEDKPGVLSRISAILAANNISIASVIQKERGQIVPIVMLTHKAKEASVQNAIKEIDKLPIIKETSTVVRIEDFD